MINPILESIDLCAWFGEVQALKNISMACEANKVTAIIGPSGCGKSTFIRCLNRLHEETPGARTSGALKLNGKNIFAPDIDPVALRRKIGMVFQRPNPFPSLSIFDNVVVGLKLAGLKNKNLLQEIAEKSLRHAALWDEVKDKLKAQGTSLSGGQQQRLCIARALAVGPSVLLMDEPTSALILFQQEKLKNL
jgi:phosphate transport system ATP-binding protein